MIVEWADQPARAQATSRPTNMGRRQFKCAPLCRPTLGRPIDRGVITTVCLFKQHMFTRPFCVCVSGQFVIMCDHSRACSSHICSNVFSFARHSLGPSILITSIAHGWDRFKMCVCVNQFIYKLYILTINGINMMQTRSQ
jgi:hypothetical protein